MGPERGSEILCVLTHGMGSTPPTPGADGAPRRIWHPFGRLRWKSTSDVDHLCSCIMRTSILKSAANFWSSKALKSVLYVLTLKVPTLTRRGFLRFTTLRLETESAPSSMSRFSTSHTMMNHVCF